MNFIVGERYVSASGYLIRAIEKIHGDDIYWTDASGSGRCSRKRFEEWAAPFPPDYLAQKPKRAKTVTQAIIKAVKGEASKFQKFRSQIASIETKSLIGDKRDIVAATIGMISVTGEHLKRDLSEFPGYSSRLRAATRVDTSAEALLSLISSLQNILHSSSSVARTECGKLLMPVLIDGSDCLNRLRSSLKDVLVQ